MNFIDERNYKEDFFQAYMVQDARTGKKRIKFFTPSMVVHIDSDKELKLQLSHYSRAFIQDQVPDSAAARKNLIEHIRPALRYWCQKYSVKIPEWLKNEKQYLDLSDAKKMELFGTTKLSVQEFRKFKRVPLNDVKTEMGVGNVAPAK